MKIRKQLPSHLVVTKIRENKRKKKRSGKRFLHNNNIDIEDDKYYR